MCKIFNVGLPKTGTTSLNEALTVLGYRSCHNPIDLRLATYEDAIYRYERDDWDALTNFGEHFYPQLDVSYPHSKFILTIRDRESWLKSSEKWYGQPPQNPPIDYKCHLETFGCMSFSRVRFAHVYDLHRRNVIDYFRDRPGDLLVLNCRDEDAWQKLCSFLGKTVPERPFPHRKNAAHPRNSFCRRMVNTLRYLASGRYY